MDSVAAILRDHARDYADTKERERRVAEQRAYDRAMLEDQRSYNEKTRNEQRAYDRTILEDQRSYAEGLRDEQRVFNEALANKNDRRDLVKFLMNQGVLATSNPTDEQIAEAYQKITPEAKQALLDEKEARDAMRKDIRASRINIGNRSVWDLSPEELAKYGVEARNEQIGEREKQQAFVDELERRRQAVEAQTDPTPTIQEQQRALDMADAYPEVGPRPITKDAKKMMEWEGAKKRVASQLAISMSEQRAKRASIELQKLTSQLGNMMMRGFTPSVSTMSSGLADPTALTAGADTGGFMGMKPGNFASAGILDAILEQPRKGPTLPPAGSSFRDYTRAGVLDASLEDPTFVARNPSYGRQKSGTFVPPSIANPYQ